MQTTPTTQLDKDGALSLARHSFLLVYLLLMCAVALWAVVGTLGAYQFQDRAKKYLGEDYDSIFAVVREARRLETSRRERARIRAELDQLTVVVEVAEAPSPEALEDLSAVYNDYWGRLDSRLMGQNERLDQELASTTEPYEYRTLIERSASELPEDARESLRALVDDFDAELGQTLDTIEPASGVPGDASAPAAVSGADAAKRSKLLARIDEIDRQRAAAGRLVEIGLELDHMDRSCLVAGRFCLGSFAEHPQAVLVLLLTIAMGALGSTLYMMQQYVSGAARNRKLDWFLVRPVLGISTALAILILVRSGQLAFSEPSPVGSSLNPWATSFLAIVSGLLSEQAIERLAAAGRSVFRSEDDADVMRWLNPIALSGADLDAAAMARDLGVPTNQLEAWLDSSDGLGERDQRLLAAWLRVPVRELFTDIPPRVDPHASEE